MSNTSRHARNWITALLIALPCLASCSNAFVMKIDGDVNHSVTFRFFEAAADAQPSRQDIVEFVVQEQDAGGQWLTAWELAGQQSLSSIQYGSAYEGLKQRAEAKPLVSNRHYRTLAKSRSMTSRGYASLEFSFDAQGKLIAQD